LPERNFLLGGIGWDGKSLPPNVRNLGHVYTPDHNAFNCTPRAVLNISRASMARYGFSPATRVFEAAGAGACLITDAWTGIEQFFVPGHEILPAACAEEVISWLRHCDRREAAKIGTAMRERALRNHTYELRAAQLHSILQPVIA